MCLESFIPTQVPFFPSQFFPPSVQVRGDVNAWRQYQEAVTMGIMQCSTHVGLYWGCQYEEAAGQKGVFRVAQDTTAPCMSHSSVWWAQVSLGWAAWGEFGLRTSCPEWTEDTSGVPWCHRGMPPTNTMVQCNHSQSEGIHEFIPALGIRKQTTSVHYLSTFWYINLFLQNLKYLNSNFNGSFPNPWALATLCVKEACTSSIVKRL